MLPADGQAVAHAVGDDEQRPLVGEIFGLDEQVYARLEDGAGIEPPKRTTEDMLEEVLDLVRGLARVTSGGIWQGTVPDEQAADLWNNLVHSSNINRDLLYTIIREYVASRRTERGRAARNIFGIEKFDEDEEQAQDSADQSEDTEDTDEENP